jgi:hypothetical protein
LSRFRPALLPMRIRLDRCRRRVGDTPVGI